NIIGHGYSTADFDEDVLRVESYGALSGSYEVETYHPWDGVNTYSTIPAGDFTNIWVHLVGTYDGTNWNLFRNGQLVSQTTTDTHGAYQAVGDWGIAANPGGTSGSQYRYFHGNVSAVAVYDHALTPSRVTEHYARAIYGTNQPPTIVAHSSS